MNVFPVCLVTVLATLEVTQAAPSEVVGVGLPVFNAQFVVVTVVEL